MSTVGDLDLLGLDIRLSTNGLRFTWVPPPRRCAISGPRDWGPGASRCTGTVFCTGNASSMLGTTLGKTRRRSRLDCRCSLLGESALQIAGESALQVASSVMNIPKDYKTQLAMSLWYSSKRHNADLAQAGKGEGLAPRDLAGSHSPREQCQSQREAILKRYTSETQHKA